ncbi:GGDEF domain-containing protein [Vibrio sp. ZSDE26]|uniref:diguanylate cyclase n=1 Tax=Vibrio amylolyticus TaxID=2847292 RepID=A0A9X1XHD7_9VIBR|nr:GGDEF domain-containing protein [Vibrio amylolyticus]MCK6261813.1 GGDEF domain-containing protein [Vibrio amylolyticus]
MSVEQKILQLVVEITEQTNSISLAHCVIATLAEMAPIKSIHLFHYIGHHSHLIAAVRREEKLGEEPEFHWLQEQDQELADDFDHEMSETVVEKRAEDEHWCTFPIQIDDTSSARFIIVMTGPPQEFELLINGFCQIYKNYLIILHESERDELTGLYNRKMMEQKLTQSYESLSNGEFNEEYSPRVAILDIDKFKSINDTHGHLIGDEVLLTFSQQMQQYFSGEELLFRFGGEEFVVLFPRTKLNEAEEKLEGFRQHIEQYNFPQVPFVTFSAGLCSVLPTDFIPSILDHADKALYYAKDNGRNKVCNYHQLKQEGIFNDDDDSDSDVELF